MKNIIVKSIFSVILLALSIQTQANAAIYKRTLIIKNVSDISQTYKFQNEEGVVINNNDKEFSLDKKGSEKSITVDFRCDIYRAPKTIGAMYKVFTSGQELGNITFSAKCVPPCGNGCGFSEPWVYPTFQRAGLIDVTVIKQ